MSEFWKAYKDPRWQKRRLEKMQHAEFQCERCGDTQETLNVHHKIYRKGHKPWEYELFDLECLCEPCHEHAHKYKDRLKEAIASMDWMDFEELVGFAEAVAAKTQCEESMEVLSPHHADGISAAFAYHSYVEVLDMTTDGKVTLDLLGNLLEYRRVTA